MKNSMIHRVLEGEGSCLTTGEEKQWQTWQRIKKERHYFAYKGLCNQSYGFSSSPVWMWELDDKKGWVLKNWCLQTVVLVKTLWKSLGQQRSNQLILKEINPEYSLERLMPKLNPVLWLPDEKSQLIGKDPDAGKDWRQEEKGTTEGEMVGWHHWLNGHESEQTARWWRTGKPGVLQSMGLQRVGHDWAAEQQQREE